MKRYLLFAGANYYPSGGWDDFVDSFDTLDEAIKKLRGDWAHVIDVQTGKKVAKRGE